MRIRTKTRTEKASRTRKRNANPLLAAKKLAERPQPADGIRFKRSKVTGEMLEFCVTPEAKHLRRIEVWEQAKGDCQGCGHGVGDPEDSGYHWHHRKHRSQGGDDSLANAFETRRARGGGLMGNKKEKNMSGYSFAKPKKEPYLNLEISRSCWNGFHRHLSKNSHCSGWVELTDAERDAKKETTRCECPCHDDLPLKAKKVKPVSMDLPDVGTLDIGKNS